MSAKWRKGLRLVMAEKESLGQCLRCGSCCAFISIPPFREDELDQLPAEIQQVVDWYTQHDPARPKSPVPCYFYDMTKRTCLIHEHKPHMCREFEPDGPACRKVRSDLRGPLNAYYNATKHWARHYTRIVGPGGRIQEIGDFSFDDEVAEGMLKT